MNGDDNCDVVTNCSWAVQSLSLECNTINISNAGARFTKYRMTILRLITITPKLRSTYGRPICQTSYEERTAFLGMIYMQNLKIVGDSVRMLAYDIPKRNLSTFKSLS